MNAANDVKTGICIIHVFARVEIRHSTQLYEVQRAVCASGGCYERRLASVWLSKVSVSSAIVLILAMVVETLLVSMEVSPSFSPAHLVQVTLGQTCNGNVFGVNTALYFRSV